MQILLSADYETMSKCAAEQLIHQINGKPNTVLGLATGSTPLGLYRELVRAYKNGIVSFEQVRTVNLDEYCGLSPSHSQSYAYFMHHNLFDHINIKPEHVHLPNGLNADAVMECEAYDALIESLGGVDLQLLGIGNNGHIGFNEPADSFTIGTNRIALEISTIEANSRFFEHADEVPRFAYTMGIKQILHAKKIVLVANGKNKADILYEALFGPVTPRVPASILQFAADLTVYGDQEALSVIAQKRPEALI